MANETVRFTPGQFSDPNSDSNKVTANNDVDTSGKSVTSGVVFSQLVRHAKSTIVTMATKGQTRKGNISQSDKINKTIGIVGDVSTIAVGFGVGGPIGAGLAAVGVGVQKGLQAEEISYQLQVDDLTAREDSKRAGIPVNDRGGFR